jgi:hypothetical protein
MNGYSSLKNKNLLSEQEEGVRVQYIHSHQTATLTLA